MAENATTVLTPSSCAEEATKVAEDQDPARRREHLRRPLTRGFPDAETSRRRLGQEEKCRQRKKREEAGRAQKGAAVLFRPHERQGGQERRDGARVAHGEAPCRYAPLMASRSEIGQVGVVVDEGALITEIPHHPEHEAPNDHPGLHREHERRRHDGQRREPDEERPPYARAVGQASQER
jgi:hypothetical protein